MSTNRTKRSIVLFEDRAERIEELRKEITPLLGSKFKLTVFPLDQKPERDFGPYEDRLVAALSDPSYGDVVLIVTDRDLSTQKWGGLSEAAVTRAAEKLGFPVACYRQAKQNPEDRLKRIPGNGQLELPFEADARARRIIAISKGFLEMEKLLQPKPESHETAIAKPTKKPKGSVAEMGAGTPGTLLARILGQPDIGHHFDLFACGDQRAIMEVMKASKGNPSKLTVSQGKRLVVALGVWLADLVMEYPGLLLNDIAAASYLDIHPDDFTKARVREIFQSARYSASLPFADADEPMWWRHRLDQLVNEAQALSGLDLCKLKGLRRLRFCPCSVRPTLHAGFYCMASRKPLSEQESSGRVSWFPIGADLARLTARTHRALAPWIGS
ncbi:hypothetical protein [Burkholderia gladioli]|uniref:hypothetical protein n=1 Tax=Burkholderia gladioli TaxID=28095 RepID=UPI00163F083B|nr:hypothetical protein [Burkholderia gladioli]